jgi:hypothetical protein
MLVSREGDSLSVWDLQDGVQSGAFRGHSAPVFAFLTFNASTNQPRILSASMKVLDDIEAKLLALKLVEDTENVAKVTLSGGKAETWTLNDDRIVRKAV